MQRLSRISRTQSHKIWIQSMLLLGGTAIVIAVFVLILLPLTLRKLEAPQTKRPAPSAGVALPPSKPIVFPLPTATNSASLVVAGFAPSGTAVLLLNNGTQTQETVADSNGNFRFDMVKLQKDANRIEVVAQTDAGTQATADAQIVTFSSDQPTLTIDQPQNNTTYSKRRDQVITVSGSTEKNAQVFINDKVVLVDPDGHFNTQFQLQNGTNAIVVRSVSAAGNEAKQELSIAYQP